MSSSSSKTPTKNKSSSAAGGAGVSGTKPSSSSSSKDEDILPSLAEIFNTIAKRELSDDETREALSFLSRKSGVAGQKVSYYNETKTVDKIKYHLIYQNRGKDAKEFIELQHKLKEIPLLKKRECMMELFYSLFNKDQTKPGNTSTTSSSSTTPQSQQSVEGSYSTQPPEAIPILKLKRTTDVKYNNELMKVKKFPPLDDGAEKKFESSHLYHVEPSDGSKIPGSMAKYYQKLQSPAEENSMKINFIKPPPIEFKSAVNYQHHQQQYLPLGNRSFDSANSYTMSIKSMEKVLIKDLIFIFQGIDGNIIKGNSTGGYEIITKDYVHPSLRLQTLRLCELGFFYKKIKTFIDQPAAGLMIIGLKHALDQELLEYYRLLAIVQPQIQRQMAESPMTPFERNGGGLTLQKLLIWMYDVKPRLDLLSCMIDACQGKKGGEICSLLYMYMKHGDPSIVSLTTSLLSIVAKPLYSMICQWILYGDLQDNHHEFFISQDVNCKPDQLWHSKFHIRRDMLPTFITMKQAEKFLATGKNINFLKEICRINKGFDGRNKVKGILENSPVECLFLGEDHRLSKAIETAYETTSAMVLKVLIEESRLLDHLRAIKRYLLLGQGDFIQYLLELIQGELSKPASKLFTHNISGILESAIRATNAQYEDEDILLRLDSRITACSDKDLGWDVFCLDYKVQGPIGTVLTEDVMINYNQLFNTLWRAKRIERILSSLWKNQTALFKIQRIIPEIGPVLLRSQLLISEMINFVHQMQYYIMIEATEVGWNGLLKELEKAKDLDQVIGAHNNFMRTIKARALLETDSQELLNQIRSIFSNVLELKSFLASFDQKVMEEVVLRKETPNSHEEQVEAQRKFFQNIVSTSKGKIELLYTTTQDLIRGFLYALSMKPDLNLQCLCFRLDFNEYYQHKDSRLSLPLTHQHRRLSMAPLGPIYQSMSAISLSGQAQVSQAQLFTSIQEISFDS